jgi:hypothetical protein
VDFVPKFSPLGWPWFSLSLAFACGFLWH